MAASANKSVVIQPCFIVSLPGLPAGRIWVARNSRRCFSISVVSPTSVLGKPNCCSRAYSGTLLLVMRPLLWPGRSCRSSSPTPAQALQPGAKSRARAAARQTDTRNGANHPRRALRGGEDALRLRSVELVERLVVPVRRAGVGGEHMKLATGQPNRTRESERVGRAPRSAVARHCGQPTRRRCRG